MREMNDGISDEDTWMKTLYYITRTFTDPQEEKACGMIRNAYVNFLKHYFSVTVVTPAYDGENIINDDYIKLNYKARMMYPYMERIGLLEDYLDVWVNMTLEVMTARVKSDDIIFATSGGELACIKLGSILKKRVGCRFVVNFHDPVDYSNIDGRKTCGFFHVSRENAILKYLSNSDYIITSSDKFREVLEEKYYFLRNKIVNSYFGYINKCEVNVNHFEKLRRGRERGEKIRLVFGGSMNEPQGAEFFTHLLKERKDIEIVYIGNASKKIKKAAKMRNVAILEPMVHDAYLRYMTENADIGLVSLATEPYKACFPSKIFECINLEMPILAALPDGDAKRVINEKGYGRAVVYGDMVALQKALEDILTHYEELVKNIKRDKPSWAMEKKLGEVIDILQKV